MDSYVLMHALMGQNHLLQELRARPRYILDEEWAELERMLRNSCDLTSESLREEHPDLTKGDIRTYILSASGLKPNCCLDSVKNVFRFRSHYFRFSHQTLSCT